MTGWSRLTTTQRWLWLISNLVVVVLLVLFTFAAWDWLVG